MVLWFGFADKYNRHNPWNQFKAQFFLSLSLSENSFNLLLLLPQLKSHRYIIHVAFTCIYNCKCIHTCMCNTICLCMLTFISLYWVLLYCFVFFFYWLIHGVKKKKGNIVSLSLVFIYGLVINWGYCVNTLLFGQFFLLFCYFVFVLFGTWLGMFGCWEKCGEW